MTGIERQVFRVTGFRTVLLADGSAVRCLGCRTGSGSPAAPSSIIPFQTGAARLTAGVIHSQLVLIPSGSGLTPPNEISYRGVKLPRFSAAFGPLVGAAWARFAAGGPASRGGDQASGAGAYLCSLGTNTVLGNVTNGLFGLLFAGGAEN